METKPPSSGNSPSLLGDRSSTTTGPEQTPGRILAGLERANTESATAVDPRPERKGIWALVPVVGVVLLAILLWRAAFERPRAAPLAPTLPPIAAVKPLPVPTPVVAVKTPAAESVAPAGSQAAQIVNDASVKPVLALPTNRTEVLQLSGSLTNAPDRKVVAVPSPHRARSVASTKSEPNTQRLATEIQPTAPRGNPAKKPDADVRLLEALVNHVETPPARPPPLAPSQ